MQAHYTKGQRIVPKTGHLSKLFFVCPHGIDTRHDIDNKGNDLPHTPCQKCRHFENIGLDHKWQYELHKN